MQVLQWQLQVLLDQFVHQLNQGKQGEQGLLIPLLVDWWTKWSLSQPVQLAAENKRHQDEIRGLIENVIDKL